MGKSTEHAQRAKHLGIPEVKCNKKCMESLKTVLLNIQMHGNIYEIYMGV